MFIFPMPIDKTPINTAFSNSTNGNKWYKEAEKNKKSDPNQTPKKELQAMSNTPKWQTIPSIKGLQVRIYSKDEKAYRYRFQGSQGTIIDYLGIMPEAEALKIMINLKQNRKLGTGPQTYKEMQDLQAQAKQATFIKEQRKEKALIQEQNFLQSHTVANFWDNYYWPDRSQRGGEKSNKAILYTFNKYWRHSVGSTPIEELQYKQIEEVINSLKQSGKSNRMIQYTYRMLQTMYNHARIIFSSDFKKDLPIFCGARIKLDSPTIKNAYFTKGEIKALFAELKKDPCRDAHDMSVLALYSGLRFGDIKNLKWCDIREDQATPIRTRKTGRVVYASLNFAPILEMLKERNIFKLKSKADELVFLNRHGEQYNAVPPIFAKTIKKLNFNEMAHRKNNPVEKVDFQTLRRTFASWLAQSGADLQSLRDLMGHNNVTTTQVYAILNQSKTAELLQNLIDA